MSSLLQDLRYASRTLCKSPGFAILAIATLAIGIGANSTILSVVRGVLLEPLPFRDPEAPVRIGHARPDAAGPSSFSPQVLEDLDKRSSSFESMGGE